MITWAHDPLWDKTTILYIVYRNVMLMDSDPKWKACHQQIWLATNIKFAGVNLWSPTHLWQDQHRSTTKNLFYLELKRNRNCMDFLLAEEITIPMEMETTEQGQRKAWHTCPWLGRCLWVYGRQGLGRSGTWWRLMTPNEAQTNHTSQQAIVR
jgi:hypothetical protein